MTPTPKAKPRLVYGRVFHAPYSYGSDTASVITNGNTITLRLVSRDGERVEQFFFNAEKAKAVGQELALVGQYLLGELPDVTLCR